MKIEKQQLEVSSFEEKYPHIADWFMGGGWIEIGQDDSGHSNSFVRALDEGGMAYAGEAKYKSMDAAFQALDAGIKDWLDENG